MSIIDDLDEIELNQKTKNGYCTKVHDALSAMYSGLNFHELRFANEPLCYLFETEMNLSFTQLYHKIINYSYSEIDAWLLAINYPAIPTKLIRKPTQWFIDNFGEFCKAHAGSGEK